MPRGATRARQRRRLRLQQPCVTEHLASSDRDSRRRRQEQLQQARQADRLLPEQGILFAFFQAEARSSRCAMELVRLAPKQDPLTDIERALLVRAVDEILGRSVKTC